MSLTKHETIDRVMEYGIYVFIFFMFISKGEGIRNTIIFGNLALWLVTLKHRKNLYLLKDPVSIWCWIYIGTTVVSAVFSIDPLFSLNALRDDPLKFACLFPVVATVMTDEEKFRKLAAVSLFSLVFIVAAAYYSYMIYDLEMLKPNTLLVHQWHGRFGRYLCFLIPFSFVLYLVLKRQDLKMIVTVLLGVSVFALILSTSRTGYAGFMIIVFVWGYFYSKKTMINVKKTVLLILAVYTLSGVAAYFIFPDVGRRINAFTSEIDDFNERTQIWRSAVYAIGKRPVVGWGYGNSLFKRPEPYEGTPYPQPPEKGPHNIVIKTMFHQGIIGTVPYILLVLTAAITFRKAALALSGTRSYVLIAGVSVLCGNYMFQSMLSVPEFDHLAVLLGVGVAAKSVTGGSPEGSYHA